MKNFQILETFKNETHITFKLTPAVKFNSTEMALRKAFVPLKSLRIACLQTETLSSKLLPQTSWMRSEELRTKAHLNHDLISQQRHLAPFAVRDLEVVSDLVRLLPGCQFCAVFRRKVSDSPETLALPPVGIGFVNYSHLSQTGSALFIMYSREGSCQFSA